MSHPWQEYNAYGNTCHYPGCRMTEDEHATSPKIDHTGSIHYYETVYGSWHGSDNPGYLRRYIRQRGGDQRAEAVLAYRLSQMSFCRRWWHRFTWSATKETT